MHGPWGQTKGKCLIALRVIAAEEVLPRTCVGGPSPGRLRELEADVANTRNADSSRKAEKKAKRDRSGEAKDKRYGHLVLETPQTEPLHRWSAC